jgi:hypothetical protein
VLVGGGGAYTDLGVMMRPKRAVERLVGSYGPVGY